MQIETKIAPKSGWFTPAEAKAYYGRYSREGLTVHWWGGGEPASAHDNIVNYFMAQGAQGIKSVNYVVSDIKITKMVEPDNVAWASQSGNATTVSIEFQPTLSAQGYKNGGWLIAQLEKQFGHKLTLYPHNHWFQTDCPGTIDINRLRAEADKGGEEMIQDSPNEFGRWSKVATQIRGRHRGFTHDEFLASAVNRTWLQALEILSDDPESDKYYSDSNLSADDLNNLMGELGVPTPPNPNDIEYHINQQDGHWKTSFYDLIQRKDRTKIPTLQKVIADLQAQVGKAGGTIDPKTQAQLDKIDQNTTDTKNLVQRIIDLLLSKFTFSKKK